MVEKYLNIDTEQNANNHNKSFQHSQSDIQLYKQVFQNKLIKAKVKPKVIKIEVKTSLHSHHDDFSYFLRHIKSNSMFKLCLCYCRPAESLRGQVNQKTRYEQGKTFYYLVNCGCVYQRRNQYVLISVLYFITSKDLGSFQVVFLMWCAALP